jgi:type I site-specific restriction-modification system R (restriction) subunit
MVNVQFPGYPFKIKSEQGREVIFDENRKQWVNLSPEEWVRQNFLQYLVHVKKYPASLIAVEREISLGDLKKRFDIVVFKNAVPWMIVECKEMRVELSEAVIKQILNYNITLQVQYLVVTNGNATFALHLSNGKFEWLENLPEF